MRTAAVRSGSVVALLVALAVLVGCGGSGGGGADSKSLTIALPAARPETTFITKNLPAFEKSSGLKVKVVQVPYENLHTKLATEFLGGGSSYDVVGMPYEWIPAFASHLQPLDSALTAADRRDFLPAAMRAMSYQGHVYGEMYALTCQVLFYRTDLLHQAGLKVPTTWSSYLAAARKLTKPPQYGTMVTAANNPEPVGMFLDYLYQAGGNVVDASGHVTVNSPAGVRALTFMDDQVHKEKVAPPGAAGYTTAETTTMFTEGKLAMAPNWVYMYALANGKDSKVKGRFGVAPLPAGTTRGASIGGWILGVAKSSQKQRNAEKLVAFMTDAKRQEQMATEYGNIPTRLSASRLPAVTKLAYVRPAVETLKYGVSRVKSPAWPDMETALAQAISAAVSGSATPKAALDKAASQIQNALDSSSGA